MAPRTGAGRVTLSRLFVYGTLQDDAVVQELLGHRLFGRPAVLKGYRRELESSIGYPVIHPREGDIVPGKLLDGLDPDALAILDAYEGNRYRRVVVQVETLEGRLLDAYAYIPAVLPQEPP